VQKQAVPRKLDRDGANFRGGISIGATSSERHTWVYKPHLCFCFGLLADFLNRAKACVREKTHMMKIQGRRDMTQQINTFMELCSNSSHRYKFKWQT